MKKVILLVICFLFSNIVMAENYKVYSNKKQNIEISEEKTLFILDFSNSMNEYLAFDTKIDTMYKTMKSILSKVSPQKVVGMRAYGYRIGLTPYDSCRVSKLVVPMIKGGNVVISEQLKTIKAVGMTPITYSLKQALNKDFNNFLGSKHIILLTDGGENCDESPCTFITKNLKNYKNLKIDVIAYDIHNSEDISQLECVALVTSGKFYTANTASELVKSLEKTLNVQKAVDAKILFH